MNNILKKTISVRKTYADIGIAVVIIALALFMLFVGNVKFIKIGIGSVGIVNDRLFPNILMVVAIICSIGIIVSALPDLKHDKELIAKGEKPAEIYISAAAPIITAVGIFFYMTMKTIGYPLCNFICVGAVYYLHGGRKPLKGILVAGLFTLACYMFFGVYLGVHLPLGFGR